MANGQDLVTWYAINDAVVYVSWYMKGKIMEEVDEVEKWLLSTNLTQKEIEEIADGETEHPVA